MKAVCRWIRRIRATAQQRRVVGIAPAEQVVVRMVQPAADLLHASGRRDGKRLHLLRAEAGGPPCREPGRQRVVGIAEVFEQVAQWSRRATGQDQRQQGLGFMSALVGEVWKDWHARMLVRKPRRRPRAPSCCCVGLCRAAYWASGCLSS